MAEVTNERREELEALEESISRPNRGIIATQDFVDPDTLYAELIARIRKYHPNTDITMVEKAYHLARDAHEGQARKSGEPYIIHPLCVAIILADLEMDKETIVAGILHDVVEDTVYTREEITEEFSAEVMVSPSWVSWHTMRTRLRCRRRTCARCFWLWPRTSV